MLLRTVKFDHWQGENESAILLMAEIQEKEACLPVKTEN